MDAEIVMPRMGLNMEQGTILRWLKREGERVVNGEDLFEIETDKTNVIIQATADGVLGKVVYNEGDTIPIGTVIAYLSASGKVEEGRSSNASTAGVNTPNIKASNLVASNVVGANVKVSNAVASNVMTSNVKASPAARRLAHDLGVDLAELEGSGPGGRVVAWNVQEASDAQKASPVTRTRKPSPLAQRMAQELGVDVGQVQGTGSGGQVTREDVERAAKGVETLGVSETPSVLPKPIERVTNVHRVMATRMAASFSTAPHFYLHVQVDVRALTALREQLVTKLEQRAGVHLTFTDLLIKLTAHALTLHPNLRAQWADEGLRRPEGTHIGVAVEAPTGLFVPVLQHADKHGLTEIARWRMAGIEKARTGKLLPTDLEGGVFTISNLGMYRVDWFEAILNPPQAAILAVGRIKEQPVVERGQVIAAPMMNLSLSVDHRVVDGAQAARFVTDLAELIENPSLALA